MRRNLSRALAGSSLLVLASSLAAQAQTTAAASDNGTEEIVVTARRKSENIQDVPVVVNAVTSKTLQNMNIRTMSDIANVVPGLTITPAVSTGGTTTLRGVNFDENVSGGDSTVTFYINDEPVSADFVFESLYDIQQIEVLRGPQGTLRGTPSPSGSISLTTTRPDMEKYGGYAESTITSLGTTNVNAAVNIPVVQDKLAVRVAGLFEDNESTRIHSINNPDIQPYSHQRGIRTSVKFDPTDDLDILGVYSHYSVDEHTFDQVESANIADPTQPASPTEITAKQRLAVEALPRIRDEKTNDVNLLAQYRFAGQKLNYVFGYGDASYFVSAPQDVGDFFNPSYPGNAALPNPPGFGTTANLQNYTQLTYTHEYVSSHEIRLSSDEPLFGRLDYVVGALFNRLQGPTVLWADTPIFFGPTATPATGNFINISRIALNAKDKERSFFGNVTYHLTSNDEISAGVRGERYTENGYTEVFTSATPAPAETLSTLNNRYHPWIYSASLKHRFNDDVMVYASTGSSWRTNAQTNALFDGQAGDLFPYGSLATLDNLPPETSKNYEIGVKSSWLDRTLTLNVTGYHQTFKNFYLTDFNVLEATRTAIGPGGSATTGPNPGDTFGLADVAFYGVAVPARVNGIEGDFNYQPTKHFNVGGTFAYASSKITNGNVPCSASQYTTVPTTGAALVALAGGQQFLTCKANYSAGFAAPFSFTANSEYSHPITGDVDGFIRGLLQFKGNSQNNPINPYDNIPAYAQLSLFIGVRSADSNWSVTAYGKDINDAQRVLTRSAVPYTTSYVSVVTGSQLGATTYRGITMTPPREFGITARYAFGSR